MGAADRINKRSALPSLVEVLCRRLSGLFAAFLMTEDSFPEGENDFSPDPDRTEAGFGSQEPEFGSQESEDFASSFAPEESSPGGVDVSFALTMARTWVKEHQTKAMLGAFATGVVVGSLLRE